MVTPVTDPTEAEARLDESRRWLVFAMDSGPFVNGATALAGHEEMVRATEREKVRAEMQRLHCNEYADAPDHVFCGACFNDEETAPVAGERRGA